MTPVYQTKFKSVFEPTNSKGNCLAACFASILDLELRDVPKLENFGPGEWQEEMFTWLNTLGLDLEVYSKNIPPDGWAIAGGDSPRGDYSHAIVVLNGLIVHDPHWSCSGLSKVNYFWKIVNLKEM